ncbi:MAG: LamG-like jellyroll fold domain-containing protein, partial [Verrucomicrobiota bacterium]|nr:LamG-like jellyroll fold domain-containing protein [Verrucomicrobiota bacterium]
MLTFTYNLVDSAEIPVQEGLVAQWDFDETTGQVARDSKGDLHGDLINFGDEASHWVPGRVGGAISFNGSNHIEVADDPSIGGDIQSAMTIMAWFKSNVALDAGGAGNRMLEKGNSYFFLQGVGSGGMNFLVKDGGANRTATIGESLEADQWYHITGVVDNGQARVYLNGEPKNAINLNGPVDDAQMTLYIGSDDSGNHFNGLMDQLLIFNRALSDAEIISILQASEPDGPPEIVNAPVGDTIFEGGTLSLSVDADGAPPLHYQWFRGETILRSQTSDTLIIEYAQTSDAGDYSVVVSNDAGEVKTTPASVTITPITS